MQVDLDLSLIGLTLRPQAAGSPSPTRRKRRQPSSPPGVLWRATRLLLSHCRLQVRSLTVYLPDTEDSALFRRRQGAVLALIAAALSTLRPLLHSSQCRPPRVQPVPPPGGIPKLDLVLYVRLCHLLPPLLLLLFSRMTNGKIKKKGKETSHVRA